MLKEIIEKYNKFSDSLVTEINYKYDKNDNLGLFDISIGISSMNFMKQNKFEQVKLKFKNVIHFKFLQTNGFPGFMMNEIYISEKEGVITFDFFPIDHFNYLEENPNSEFIIKCKEISYEVIKEGFE